MNDRPFVGDCALVALRPVLYSRGVQHSAPALLMQPGAWHRELEAPGASDTLPSQSGRFPRQTYLPGPPNKEEPMSTILTVPAQAIRRGLGVDALATVEKRGDS